jgi:predicted dehydrogenase/threonine dehydrogenase-like Zn-dependent dehydrogenase
LKQVLQNLGTGETLLADVPAPQLADGHVLISTRASVISAGTERMVVEFGRSNLWQKARQQPDKVRQVLDKVRTDGLMTTYSAVKSRLDQRIPLGYCNAGTVVATGRGVSNLVVGQRVVSNGYHAEIVRVPQNLCAPIPDTVRDDQAAFTVLGAIAMQGVRLANPTLGETFAVIGLGLLGLLTVQLLRANGCRVIGVDLDRERLGLAHSFGAETVDLSVGQDAVAMAQDRTRGCGVDGVLITAATQSSDPVKQAAHMCRKRGRIVLVGVTGLELSRADFYEKELSFQVSCSYGPGRYDPQYEEKGHDYPYGFVRWTEQRNFEAVLDLLASGTLNVDRLISHRFPIESAHQAYDLLANGKSYLGIVLEYSGTAETVIDVGTRSEVTIEPTARVAEPGEPVLGLIGAGGYASQVLVPALKRTGVDLQTVASSGGTSAVELGRRHGFREATTDVARVLADPRINVIVIATRHNTHADLACAALQAGKHVFVEKPLALTMAQLEQLEKTYRDTRRLQEPPSLMIGFNRRFAPQIERIQALLRSVQAPKSMVMTVNAGAVPANHWTQDIEIGGGRIIGEGCHFIDLLRYLVGEPITGIKAFATGDPLRAPHQQDNVSFTLQFADHSVGTVHYLANGHRSVPKERLEIFCAGRILQLNNFRDLRAYGWPQFRKMRLWRQDKGNAACVAAFIDTIRTGRPAPISFGEMVEVTRASFEVVDALQAGMLA